LHELGAHAQRLRLIRGFRAFAARSVRQTALIAEIAGESL
jgi:hypothetical protein